MKTMGKAICVLLLIAATSSIFAQQGKIAFRKHGAIFIIDCNGKNEKRLVDIGDVSFSSFSPLSYFAWSPDGKQIAFVAKRSGENFKAVIGIYVIDENGKNENLITEVGEQGISFLAWLPKGNKLAYYDNAKFKFYLVSLKDKNKEEIPVHVPCWSPDGEKIAYVKYKSTDITILNISDKTEDIIKTTVEEINYLAWSPDGEKIAFVGDGHLFIMDADGKNQTDTGKSAPKVIDSLCWFLIIDTNGKDYKQLTEGTSPKWQPISKSSKNK